MSSASRTSILIFTLGFVTAAWFFNGGGQNQNVNFDLARAVVEQRTVRVDDYRDNTVDLSFHDSHFYSNKPPGLSLLAAPVHATTRFMTRRLAVSPILRLTLDQYLSTVAVCAVSLGLTAVLVFLVGLGWGSSQRWAAFVAVAAVLATPLLPYGTMLFSHAPNALTTIGALYFAVRRRPVLSGCMAGIGATLNYLSVPAALIPLFLLLRGERRFGNVTRYLLATLPFAILMMGYHWYAFGSPITTAFSATNIEFITPGATLGVLQMPSASAVWGLLGSRYRGLFFVAPFLLPAVAGFWIQRRRPFVLASAATILLFIAFFGSFNAWHGGYTFGPRYILPIVPLLATGLFAFRGRTIWLITIPLVIWSFAINLVVTAVDPQVPEVIEDPVFSYVVPTFLAGQPPAIEKAPWLRDFFTGSVGVNRLTVAERQIFRKVPPGSPDAEWAAFNLGEPVTGAGSRSSLVPLMIIQALLGVGLWRTTSAGTQTEIASQATIT